MGATITETESERDASNIPAPTCYFCGKPIKKLKGNTGECHVLHHLDGNKNHDFVANLVDVHKKCHRSYHSSNLEHPEIDYETPVCFFCGEEIIRFDGRNKESHVFHHKNGNHQHNFVVNLADAHYGCHSAYHTTKLHEEGKIQPTEESRRKLSNSISGVNNPFFGKHHTQEAIEKNRIAHLGKNNSRYGKKLSPLHKKGLFEGRDKWWNSLSDEEKSERMRRIGKLGLVSRYGAT